jgi:hypothetical protein
MSVDEGEEEDLAQRHQQHPYQLTLRYRERFLVAQQLADSRMQYWERFKNEERDFFEHQQHQEREDKVEEEVADAVFNYHGNENNAEQQEELDNVPFVVVDDDNLSEQNILGENGEEEEAELEQLLTEEETTVYCLNLPVIEMAANNHQPNQMAMD